MFCRGYIVSLFGFVSYIEWYSAGLLYRHIGKWSNPEGYGYNRPCKKPQQSTNHVHILPTNTQRNKHIIITSKRRFDVMVTCLYVLCLHELHIRMLHTGMMVIIIEMHARYTRTANSCHVKLVQNKSIGLMWCLKLREKKEVIFHGYEIPTKL